MVISGITDGLGNQMFQYACGLAVAKAKGEVLKLDVTWFDDIEGRFTKRTYGLGNLNITSLIATPGEIKDIKEPIFPIIINSLYWRRQYALPYYKRHFFKETGFTYDGNIFKTPKNVYLQGFFQSYKYFDRIRPQLLKEFTPKVIPPVVSEKASAIRKSSNTVSLHIRRGDYLQIGNSQYVLGLDYYADALEKLKANVGEVKVLVFSDDVTWVQNNLHLNAEVEMVSLPGATAEHDIYLMSLCRHNIIANSSFSWWGAWLNSNEDKMVVAPSEWFKNNSKDTSDLIPANWIRI